MQAGEILGFVPGTQGTEGDNRGERGATAKLQEEAVEESG